MPTDLREEQGRRHHKHSGQRTFGRLRKHSDRSTWFGGSRCSSDPVPRVVAASFGASETSEDTPSRERIGFTQRVWLTEQAPVRTGSPPARGRRRRYRSAGRIVGRRAEEMVRVAEVQPQTAVVRALKHGRRCRAARACTCRAGRSSRRWRSLSCCASRTCSRLARRAAPRCRGGADSRRYQAFRHDSGRARPPRFGARRAGSARRLGTAGERGAGVRPLRGRAARGAVSRCSDVNRFMSSHRASRGTAAARRGMADDYASRRGRTAARGRMARGRGSVLAAGLMSSRGAVRRHLGSCCTMERRPARTIALAAAKQRNQRVRVAPMPGYITAASRRPRSRLAVAHAIAARTEQGRLARLRRPYRAGMSSRGKRHPRHVRSQS